ncbi:MAG: outer membrane beta-barrel protein [Thermoguttaceae bacterium]
MKSGWTIFWAGVLFVAGSWGQAATCDPCEPAACEPCEEVTACNPCDPCGLSAYKTVGSRLKVSGFIASGIYANAHGAGDNGGVLRLNCRENDANMSYLWLRFAREVDSSRGLDWGFDVDFAYGYGAPGMQQWSDESFDYGWGTGDYGWAFNNLNAKVGFGDLLVTGGIFATPIGWEYSEIDKNVFLSNSFAYWMEPINHIGVRTDYQLTEKTKLTAAWTTGFDNGFANRFNDQAALAGFSQAMPLGGTVSYYINAGKRNNGVFPNGEERTALLGDYFVQSIVWERPLGKKLFYMLQYDLSNFNDGDNRLSAYAINNHLIYTINDRWTTGARFEWCRDNEVMTAGGDFFQTTLGVNWTPLERLKLRGEIRYDTATSASDRLFNNGTSLNQFAGGFDAIFSF